MGGWKCRELWTDASVEVGPEDGHDICYEDNRTL